MKIKYFAIRKQYEQRKSLSRSAPTGEPSPDCFSPSQQLKSERAAVLTEVTRAAQELAEISVRIEEAERSADLEASLVGETRDQGGCALGYRNIRYHVLGAEMAGNEVDIANLSVRLHGLSAQEEELSRNLQHWRLKSGQVGFARAWRLYH